MRPSLHDLLGRIPEEEYQRLKELTNRAREESLRLSLQRMERLGI